MFAYHNELTMSCARPPVSRGQTFRFIGKLSVAAVFYSCMQMWTQMIKPVHTPYTCGSSDVDIDLRLTGSPCDAKRCSDLCVALRNDTLYGSDALYASCLCPAGFSLSSSNDTHCQGTAYDLVPCDNFEAVIACHTVQLRQSVPVMRYR